MADDADLAAARDELEAPMRLAASRRPEGPRPTGFCLWCEEPLRPGVRYCDAECRDGHERLLRVNGRRK